MTTLQGRLRSCFNDICIEAADKIDDLERQLANALVRDIHSCHPDCDRVGCVNARLRGRVAELERERNDFHMEYRAKYDAETKAQAVRIAALESAREVQDAALAVARSDFRELALRAEKLEAALEQARVALGEIEYSNDSRWQSDRATEALRAIEEVQR